MKIFFAASTTAPSHLQSTLRRIITLLEEQEHVVLDSWIVDFLQNSKTSFTSPRELLIHQNKLIENCDVVILDATVPSLGVGYLLARALDDRKPILCLYPEAADLEALSDGIRGATSSLITLKRYNDQNLPDVLRTYLSDLQLNRLQKFNFIVSKDILDFIEKGAALEGKSKSEFLRDKIVRELMDKELP